ncbi:ketoacyl-ACP synthase III [Paenibacillus sp. Marseille-Q4541]|uniref:ketoacyl-ACP synthase III n=1 Tax=Paenibacillus sp. Marseille-Q4541 TaxID=2831522 RepID=UPI001BAA2912|nr:ketoacyl-ACP synthase III [Paenibacillus sp. Marseille-Q4541]
MKNIRILSTAVYHPDHKVNNQSYIDMYEKQGKDVRHFFENVMGRKDRYIIKEPNKENNITMAINASRKVLETADLQPTDIDILYFATQTPEYLMPTNALILHKEIGMGHNSAAIDVNGTCVGMLLAMEQAVNYLRQTKGVKRALVVGADHISRYTREEDEVPHGNFGDAAAAILLEVTSESGGYIDSWHYINTAPIDYILFPKGGISSIQDKKDFYVDWTGFNADSHSIPPTVQGIRNLVESNGYTLDDIKSFYMSQFSIKSLKLLSHELSISMDKFKFIGDQYGYTGPSSPIIALNEAIEEGSLRRGDLIILWSVGAGMQLIASIYEY